MDFPRSTSQRTRIGVNTLRLSLLLDAAISLLPAEMRASRGVGEKKDQRRKRTGS